MMESRQNAGTFAEVAFRTAPLIGFAAVILAVSLFGSDWSHQAAAVPWILSLGLVGMPHGATDFAVSRRVWQGRSLVMLWLGYAAIMAAVVGAFAAAPVPMVVAFAVLSVWHFGLSHAEGEHPARDRLGAIVSAALTRGGVVLAPPLVFWPVETSRVAEEMATLVGVHDPASGRLLDPSAVHVLGCGLAAAVFLSIIAEGAGSWGRPDLRRRWLGGLLDSVMIGAVGCVTDPLFSVGLYFFIWHAWRQMLPLAAAFDRRTPLSWRELAGALVRIHVAAIPLLLPAWTAVVAAWWAWSPGHSARDLAVLSIAAYLVVTPAHELLGDLLRARGNVPERLPSGIKSQCPTNPSPPAQTVLPWSLHKGVHRQSP